MSGRCGRFALDTMVGSENVRWKTDFAIQWRLDGSGLWGSSQQPDDQPANLGQVYWQNPADNANGLKEPAILTSQSEKQAVSYLPMAKSKSCECSRVMPPAGAPSVVGILCLLALLATPSLADSPPDVSYIDKQSPEWSRFVAWVDREMGGDSQFGFKAVDAAYVYKVQGGTQYGDYAVQKVQAQVDAANAEIAKGKAPQVAFDSYLRVGSMIHDVALTLAWCGDRVTQAQRSEWTAYAARAVWNVWNYQDAQWGGNPFPWSGWSTSNPGNNYHFSFLEATMSWGFYRQDYAGDSSWIGWLQNNKIQPLVDYYAELPGGGSREGTGYGVSQRTLFGLYRDWRDGTGEDLAAESSHAADSVDYWIHATVPTLDRFAPIGDQSRSSYPWLYDYYRHLMLEARAMLPGGPAAERASWWLHNISVDQMDNGFNFRHDLLPAGEVQSPPSELSWHSTGTGHFFARTDWSSDALWLSFFAGPYLESHAHQDQGSFSLFKDDWLAVTENIFTKSGIRQDTSVHNVVRFVDQGQDISQKRGSVSSMVIIPGDGPELEIRADLSAAYDPAGPVKSWKRNAYFEAGGLLVHDTFETAPGVEAVWQVNTPVAPVLRSDGTANAGILCITPIQPADAELSVVNWKVINPSENGSGFKLEIRGSGTEFLVSLKPCFFEQGFESGDTEPWSRSVP